MENPWRTLDKRVVYKNPWMSLREDRVIRPDGHEGIYSVLELPHSVGVLAIDADRRAGLVEQWRYVHGRSSVEIPTGGAELEDSDIEESARRELLEETGISAGRWLALGSIDNSNGATSDVAHIFLATDLTLGTPSPTGDERITFRWVDFAHVVAMVLAGEITESVTVAAVLKVEVLRRNGVLEF